jgi:hypothetical protein
VGAQLSIHVDILVFTINNMVSDYGTEYAMMVVR